MLPTADQLQALASALPPERAALVFLFDHDSLLTWVIARGHIQFLDRPVLRSDVERRVAALAVQIGRSVKQEIWMETLAGLHDLLLRDLPGIADARDLLIVADGPLTRVPFGSLVERKSGKFMFERTSIRFAPSLAFGLRHAPAPPSDVSVLSIGAPQLIDAARSGLPPLPRAQEEAVLVAGLYPRARTLIGSSATKARVPRRAVARGRDSLRRPRRRQQRQRPAPPPCRVDCRSVHRAFRRRSHGTPAWQPGGARGLRNGDGFSHRLH